MKRVKIFSTAFAAAALALTLACNDDLGVKTYDDGMLHFKFLLDKQGQWKEDGASGPQTRMMLPIQMNLPEGFNTPLYLHCVESNTIETPAAKATTRGERITGEAFDDRNKINSFGLYAVVGEEEVLSTYTTAQDPATSETVEIKSSYTEIKRSSLTESGDWQVKETTLNFAGDGGWPDGGTGNFYGFAPLPGWDGTEAGSDPTRTRCITVNTDDKTAPTITFTMQPEEQYNKDILAANQTGVTQSQKNSGIELEFKHILSALKFNLTATNDLKYSVGFGTGSQEYYIQIKSITIEGIYDEGTVGIGETNWNLETTTGSCTSVITRSYDDITGDNAEEVKKRINTDENCMMVLPQTTPTGAKLVITADLTTDAAGASVSKPNVTFEANLNGLSWQQGHTYTYQISKDSRATNYTLTSTNGRTNNDFQFEVNGDAASGYPVDFDVTSYAEYTSDGGITTTTSPASWHLEYSEDNGTTWTKGLPLGWTVKNKTTGVSVEANDAIPGSETPVTYTLDAPVRLDGSTAYQALRTHNYTDHADDAEGYYDLSLHGLGWTAATTTTVRNTANCYIINGYGKFKLPLVYGNGIKQGVENPKAYQYTWGANSTYDASGLTYPAGHDVFCDHNGVQITKAWLPEHLGHDLSSAEIVWQDHDNIVRSSSVTLDTNKEYLCFEIRKEDVQPGNILLAVKDGNDIAWSWHIWVTVNTDFATTTELSYDFHLDSTRVDHGIFANPRYTYNYTSETYKMDVAKYSLGWTNPTIANNTGSKPYKFKVVQNDKMGKYVVHPVTQNGGISASENTSLIYQNGRKDPFPNLGLKLKSATQTSGNITAVFEQVDLFTKLGITDRTISSTEYSPSYCHKNPKSFVFSKSNWFLENGLKSNYKENQCFLCWNPEGDPQRGAAIRRQANFETHTKTIYDPCPVGFMVPNSGFGKMLASDRPYSSSTTIEYDTQHHTVTAPYDYVDTNSGIRFYVVGGRRINTSNSPWSYMMDRDYGYFWTAGAWGDGQYGVYFHTSTDMVYFKPSVGSFGRTISSGFSIRPVKDDQQGTVAEWNGEVAKNFHELDAYGVELTRNGDTNNFGIPNINSFNVTEQGGGTKTLGSIVNGTGMSNRKVLLRQIKVYFEYTGNTYGVFDIGGLLLGHRTSNSFSISHTLASTPEKHGEGAFMLVVDIPDHYVFSSGWQTKYSEKNATPSSWDFANLVPLTPQRVRITRVTADLRVTYTD